jgi:hypothetical protein
MGSNNGKHQMRGRFVLRTSVAAVFMALGCMNAAQSMEFDTGNEDVTVRWDNTVRYNVGMRANERKKIANNPNYDEGEFKFDKNDVVTNRVDLLSELDVVYKKKFGFRISGAGWYDNAYSDTDAKRNPAIIDPAVGGNPFVANGTMLPGSYINDKYTDYTKKYYKQGGELLDAFVFGTFDLGDMPLSAKYGRHALYWGEALLLGGALHGVSYSQAPLDLAKGFATPGVEAKELFRPLESLSAQLTVTPELSLAAQYFFQWEGSRLPEGGTYLGPIDMVFSGPQRVLTGFGIVPQGRSPKPDENGEFALSARWSPEALDATLGFYYRNYTDKLLGVVLTGGAARTATNPGGLQYMQNYAEDIDLYGVSLSKSIAGVSVGAELSYRKNTPLSAQVLGVTPSALNGLATSGVPAFVGAAGLLGPQLFPRGLGAAPLNNNSYQARGNTIHLVVNAVGLIPATPFFDTASYVVEGTYNRLDDVTANHDMYQGEGYGVCNKALANYVGPGQATVRGQYKDKWDGCSTKDFYGIAVNFTPTWFQVMPGIDILAPLSYSRGLKGNSAVAFGGNERNGSYAVGIAADAYQKYRFDLKYVDFFGKTKEGTLNGLPATISQNGFSTLLKDRGQIVATFKTTF